MNPELYATFVAATAALILLPGPNVALIVANSLTYGARRALFTVFGTSSAMAVHLAITCIGMTSLLVFLAEWFNVLRWFGVAYLVWLGIRAWRAPPADLDRPPSVETRPWRLFMQGFLVSLTNPKVLLFYVAFFPQFVDPGLPLVPQLVILSVTFVAIAATLDSGFAFAGSRARGFFVGRGRLLNRLTGGFLALAGLGLALARR